MRFLDWIAIAFALCALTLIGASVIKDYQHRQAEVAARYEAECHAFDVPLPPPGLIYQWVRFGRHLNIAPDSADVPPDSCYLRVTFYSGTLRDSQYTFIDSTEVLIDTARSF